MAVSVTMETSGGGSDVQRSSPDRGIAGSNGGGSSSRSYGIQFSASNLLQAPISALLEYSGILRPRSGYPENEGLADGGAVSSGLRERILGRSDGGVVPSSGGGEVSIRIIGSSEQDNVRVGTGPPQQLVVGPGRESSVFENGAQADHAPSEPEHHSGDIRTEGGISNGGLSSRAQSAPSGTSPSADGEARNGDGGNSRDSAYQRYDVQQAARWIEQILPFSLLLLVVFIRQHLQGLYLPLPPFSFLYSYRVGDHEKI